MAEDYDYRPGRARAAADAGIAAVASTFGPEWEHRLAHLADLAYDRTLDLYLDAGCTKSDALMWAQAAQLEAAAVLARVRGDRGAAIALVQGWVDQEARDARMFAEIARRRALVSPQEGPLQPPQRHGDGRSPANGYQATTDPPNEAQIALEGFASHGGE